MISDARGNHVSPGIYTEERDVAYSVKSLGITSLGLVGETLYGPAFQNVEIENWGEFVDYFGGTSTEKFPGTGLPKYELPYIAKSYLEKSNRLNVVRVLGLSGYEAGDAFVVYNSDDKPFMVFRSKKDFNFSAGTGCDGVVDSGLSICTAITISSYTDTIAGSNCGTGTGNTGSSISADKDFSIVAGGKTFNVSLDSEKSNYIYNVLGTSPLKGDAPIYIESIFENLASGAVSSWTPSAYTADTYSSYNDFKEPFRAAETPWIVSDAQLNSGTTSSASVRKLFKFHTISDGDASNFQVKVTIQNIDYKYRTFDVVVRDFNDNDEFPIVLERFSKCNLIEGDSNYIAYKIGTFDGGFISKSKYIAVQMAADEGIESFIPAGFLGYPMQKFMSGFTLNYNVKYNPDKKAKKQCFGLTNEDSDVLSYKGKYAYNESGYITNGFHMDAGISDVTVYVDGVTGYNFTTVSAEKVGSERIIPRLICDKAAYNGSIYDDLNVRKFTLCFYGGFDGWDIYREERTNTDEYKTTNYGNNTANTYTSSSSLSESVSFLNLPKNRNTSDYYAYLAGCRVFANPQDIDINIFATPGINWSDHNLLSQEIIEMIEDADEGRGGDALYVMASPNAEDVATIAERIDGAEINSSYACTYFPWVMHYDASNKKYLELPVTKDVVRNMAETDNTSYPWFAPAGMQRGSVNCIKANIKTTLADEDILYGNCINPVKSYAQDGVKIWGNKTMYNVESPLNRVNVRRLMIRVKKLITEASKNLIFEQYDETLEKQFRGLVEPILADVKANRGIIDYRVITECTPETRDQHILPAKILVKPTQALEYISISFVVYPESVSFEE